MICFDHLVSSLLCWVWTMSERGDGLLLQWISMLYSMEKNNAMQQPASISESKWLPALIMWVIAVILLHLLAVF